MPPFHTLRPGRLPFREALALQETLLDRERPGFGDVLILLEHPPVITLGRGAREENLLLPPAELARRGIACERVGRGGDVTYHGPGQLVGYPIFDLEHLGRDLHRFLRMLERVLIEVLAEFGIEAAPVRGKTGVWVNGEKIASIGIGVRRWVSWHGFALNVAADISGFSAIVPCGLQGVRMTSMERLLERPVPMSLVEERVIRFFCDIFERHHAGHYEHSRPTQARLA